MYEQAPTNNTDETSQANALTLTYRSADRNGKVIVTASIGDQVLLVESLNVTKIRDRNRFVEALCQDRPGIDPLEVIGQLLNIAAEVAGLSNETQKQSQADRLVELAEDADLFHTPGGYDSEGFATVSVSVGNDEAPNKGTDVSTSHKETWPLKSKGFRRWLAGRYFRVYDKAPGSQALEDALTVIEGKAIHGAHEHEVAVRLAAHGKAIWLDLANDDWQAVEITATRWSVVNSVDVPVRFIRKRGMLALPKPERGGSINELRSFVSGPMSNREKRFVL